MFGKGKPDVIWDLTSEEIPGRSFGKSKGLIYYHLSTPLVGGTHLGVAEEDLFSGPLITPADSHIDIFIFIPTSQPSM